MAGHLSITFNFIGVKRRAFLDTGAGSSYTSSALVNLIHSKPIKKEFKRIEMMLGSVNKIISIHNLTIHNLEADFQLRTERTKVDRKTLLRLNNSRYS